MKRYYCTTVLTVIFGLFIVDSLVAQNNWTLRSCIDYARENNIQVQKSQITEDSYAVDELQSKAALFPSLTGNATHGFSNTQVINNDGQYKFKGSLIGQYSLNTSLTIFDGKRNLNNIKEAQLKKQAQEYNTLETQNNIEISITQAYLQMLYAREAIKNSENILESTTVQLKQTKDFLDAGSITRSEYAQIEAQYSANKYDVVLAQNSFDDYKLQLKQLLELGLEVDFRVEFPDLKDDNVMQMVPQKEDIYRIALNIMPEIEYGKLGVKIANLSKVSAKAGYLPTLSLSGSIGTGDTYTQSPSFFTQIGRNFNQNIGLTLSIPIFDNRQNKSNVEKASLDIKTAELALLDEQKALLRTIETLYQDVVSAQSKYVAAKDKLESSELSYHLVAEQYNLGVRNIVELTTEKNNYANALQEFIQAKYSALLSLKLLNFYQGEEISI
ncbi:outer membrane protein [Dysgonomonas alginatilytica]|uniref:Outer membrane protein n=1 Tax=Dysgonomonas alginatilytica TaxID=1605892 RepID=A0A2V3PK61_9BACT|nr:TolC family protein [Dysgonomonas alginatilytica]PXV58901.1 outer membrane protein [Dysgonomonas alginatilytica]